MMERMFITAMKKTNAVSAALCLMLCVEGEYKLSVSSYKDVACASLLGRAADKSIIIIIIFRNLRLTKMLRVRAYKHFDGRAADKIIIIIIIIKNFTEQCVYTEEKN